MEEDPEIVELRRLMAVSAQASAESLTKLRKLNEAEVVKPKKKKAKTSAFVSNTTEPAITALITPSNRTATNTFLQSTSSEMNQSMWAPKTPSFSHSLTSSSSLPSRSGASKVQCADYKDGQNFVTWLRSFEVAAQNAGLLPEGYSQPLETRLPARHRFAVGYRTATGFKIAPTDWTEIRASIMDTIVGATNALAHKAS